MWLQLFLLVNMVVLGVAATIAAQHAYAHFLHKRHPEKDHNALKDSPLPQKVKERLLKDARNNFQDALKTSADNLRHDLKATSDRINLHLEELGNDVIHKEIDQYRQRLDKLYGDANKDVADSAADVNNLIEDHKQKLGALGDRADTVITEANKDIESYKQELKAKLDQLYLQTETAITSAATDIDEHAREIKAQLSKDVAAEKQQLLDRFDTKLADAVSSFLTETLRHNVDLGAQSDYLTSMLKEHKDELLKGLKDETKTTS